MDNYSVNLEEIYSNFKDINIYKIYYKERYYVRYIITSMTGISIILFLIFIAMVIIFKKVIFVSCIFLIVAILFLSVGLLQMKITDKKVSKKIKDQLNIEYEYKNIYTYFTIARRKKFVEYLDKIGVKSIKQKELLAKLFYQKYNETKVNNIWIAGGFAVLTLPIWNKMVDIQLPKYMNSGNEMVGYIAAILVLIVFIIAIVGFVRFVIINTILDFINTKSNQYKSMYDLLQGYILNCKSIDTYKGEITLVRK